MRAATRFFRALLIPGALVFTINSVGCGGSDSLTQPTPVDTASPTVVAVNQTVNVAVNQKATIPFDVARAASCTGVLAFNVSFPAAWYGLSSNLSFLGMVNGQASFAHQASSAEGVPDDTITATCTASNGKSAQATTVVRYTVPDLHIDSVSPDTVVMDAGGNSYTEVHFYTSNCSITAKNPLTGFGGTTVQVYVPGSSGGGGIPGDFERGCGDIRLGFGTRNFDKSYPLVFEVQRGSSVIRFQGTTVLPPNASSHAAHGMPTITLTDLHTGRTVVMRID